MSTRLMRMLMTTLVLLALATSFAALAQDATEEPTDQNTTAQQTAATPQPTVQRVTGSQQANGLPTGATLIDIVTLTGYNTYTFDLSLVGGTGQRAQAGQLGSLESQLAAQDVTLQQSATGDQLESCGNVRVYKVSATGSQDLWPNVGCAGNLLVIQAGGTGEYIFYRFSSAQAATGALLSMPLCPALAQPTQTADEQATATATSAPAVTCFWVTAHNQRLAASGQQQTTQATAQPTDDTSTAEATQEPGS